MGQSSTATIKHFWVWMRKSSNIYIFFSIHRPLQTPSASRVSGSTNIQVEKGKERWGSLSLVRAKLLHSAFQGQLGFWERFLLNVGPEERALILINLPWIHWFNLDRDTMWVCSSPYGPMTIAIPLSHVSWESLFACFPKSVHSSFLLLCSFCSEMWPVTAPLGLSFARRNIPKPALFSLIPF